EVPPGGPPAMAGEGDVIRVEVDADVGSRHGTAKAAGAAADVDDALVGHRRERSSHLTQRAVSVSDPAAVVEERRAQPASSHRADPPDPLDGPGRVRLPLS